MTTSSFQAIFDKEYARLNPEQRLAVDTIEGPVMVIAGAGTGKTQIIAMRIANILIQTQTSPQSILCLTFTDSAAATMRQRLIQIIGPAAYSVRISTFHAFCHEIIQSNPQYFIFAPDIKSLDDLDRVQIINKIIDDLPDGSLLKPWGDHYYYQSELKSTFQKLKRENITPKNLKKLISDQSKFISSTSGIFASIKELRSSSNLVNELQALVNQLLSTLSDLPNFKSLITLEAESFKSGLFDIGPAKSAAVNFKNKLLKIYDQFVSGYPKQSELLILYQNYQQQLIKRSRFDFDDMILFVTNAFANHPELLLNYQEKYQYILVDEYQDTNSAQNQVINQLGSFYHNPNLFVVGDDDQSIFRFQGAAIENIFTFYQQYQSSLKLIVLKNNYRSHQLILDSSLSVINNNKNRIANFIQNLDKSLTSVGTFDADPINLFEASSLLEENYFISQKISELLKNGVTPNQIAVLYRNNNDVFDLKELLTNQNIKFYSETGQNALENPHILQIIDLLTFLSTPSESLLYRILTFNFIGLSPFDLFKLSRYCHKNHLNLLDIIFDHKKLNQNQAKLTPLSLIKLRNISRRIAKAKRWQEFYPLDRYFNKIIRQFHYLDHLLLSRDLIKLNIFNSFYADIKRLCLEEQYTIDQLINRLILLKEFKIPINVPPLQGEFASSVRLMTVHKAKGMEFEHVFIIKCQDNKWGNNTQTSPLRLPPGILHTQLLSNNASDFEDERRLFYVALTRAKKQIYISYSSTNINNKPVLPSLFISEINPDLIQKIPPLVNYQTNAFNLSLKLKPVSQDFNPDYQQHLQTYFKQDYVFNITHLNSYLACPLCFYYKTILKLPSAKDKFAALGTAVHAALSSQFTSKSDLLAIFELSLKKELLSPPDFQECNIRGTKALSDYYDFYKPKSTPKDLVDYDFKNHHPIINSIKITGKIDKIDLLNTHIDGHQCVSVVDYKTGNPDTKSKELSPSGDYFRQLVFYKLLSDQDKSFPYKVTQGCIDFIQASSRTKKFVRKVYMLTDNDVQALSVLITQVYQKISNLEFSLSPDCPDRDDLHRLAG